jgi:hypothetical protein
MARVTGSSAPWRLSGDDLLRAQRDAALVVLVVGTHRVSITPLI